MNNELLAIFKAITPDNIKDNKLISDSMKIFIELLSEYSFISKDIKIALSEHTTDSIEEELPKIYLNDYYDMIENLKTNKNVVNKFRKWNEDLKPNIYPKGMPIIGDKLLVNYFMIGQEGGPLADPDDEVNENEQWNINPLSRKLDLMAQNILKNTPENYYINRKFKESKGLKKSIQFIYDIVNEYMTNDDEKQPLVFTETGRPFEIELISGSMDKNIYEESVAYLAHPLGFTFNYVYVSQLTFVDDFSLTKYYNIKMLEVRCLNGNVEKYNKEVSFIEDKFNYLKIVFIDGTYLLQENNVVKYFNPNDTLIKLYPPEFHCSIYLDYEIIYTTNIRDELRVEDTTGGWDDTFNVSDGSKFRIVYNPKNNFIIGISIIGNSMLSNDSDQYESVKTKEILQSIINDNISSDVIIDDSINIDTVDNDSVNIQSSDESYVTKTTSSIEENFIINEDFNIEII